MINTMKKSQIKGQRQEWSLELLWGGWSEKFSEDMTFDLRAEGYKEAKEKKKCKD